MNILPPSKLCLIFIVKVFIHKQVVFSMDHKTTIQYLPLLEISLCLLL